MFKRGYQQVAPDSSHPSLQHWASALVKPQLYLLEGSPPLSACFSIKRSKPHPYPFPDLSRTLRVKVILLAYSVAKLHPTLCNPMDCSPPRSSVTGIIPAFVSPPPAKVQEGALVNALFLLPSRFFRIVLFLVCKSRNTFGGCLFFQASPWL